ncbi:MAG: peptidase [Bacilli bacterium]|nr:peptidase [Bacilli bacterium]
MIHTKLLPNGLRIVVEDIPTVRSVSFGLWVGTGSRDESRDTNGISHFIEHMLFKGTDRLTARQIAEFFDGIGGQVNAFTSKEYTCYYAKVLDEHFESSMRTLADMLLHSQFAEEEAEKEKKVIIEEIKMYEDAPDDLVHDLLAGAIYPGNPLGYTILGTEDNINSFTRSNIINYLETRYTPDNIVLAVAGNIDLERVVELSQELFGSMQGKLQTSSVSAPAFTAAKLVRNKSTEQAHITLAMPCYAFDDPRIYAIILLNNLLGGTSSSRLFQEIREERGMAYSVYSYYSAYRDSGTFGVYAGTSVEQAQTVVDVIDSIMSEVAAKGISQEELTKAKEQVKGSLMLSLESTGSRMSRLGKNELLLRRQVSLDETLEHINAVTLSDMRQASDEILQGPIALTAIGPFDDLKHPRG